MKMKLIFSLLFIFLVEMIFGNNFSDLENFKSLVTQKTFLNNKVKEKKYEMVVKFPDLIYKKTLFPEINKGEIYVYNKNKKYIYYPLLEQNISQEIDESENEFLEILKELKGNNKGEKKNKIISNEKGLIKEIVFDTGEIIKFENYIKIKDIYFPESIDIYDENEVIVSKMKFDKITLNQKISNEIFEIGKK